MYNFPMQIFIYEDLMMENKLIHGVNVSADSEEKQWLLHVLLIHNYTLKRIWEILLSTGYILIIKIN